ncbi:Calcium-dependent protein kinase 31, partial [Dissostichus eleginoides]
TFFIYPSAVTLTAPSFSSCSLLMPTPLYIASTIHRLRLPRDPHSSQAEMSPHNELSHPHHCLK